MAKPSASMIRMLIKKRSKQKPNNFYCFDKCRRDRGGRRRGAQGCRNYDIFREFRVLFMFVQLICIPLMSRPLIHRKYVERASRNRGSRGRGKKVQKIFYACIINT